MTLRDRIIEILNDDWESIEQIYRQINFQLISTETDGTGRKLYYFVTSTSPERLTDICDELQRLVEDGSIVFRKEDEQGVVYTNWSSASPVAKCWFRPVAMKDVS